MEDLVVIWERGDGASHWVVAVEVGAARGLWA